jgi:hypothetical protein
VTPFPRSVFEKPEAMCFYLWYNKQKRADADKGTSRDMSMTVHGRIDQVNSSTRGRKRIHELLPYGTFYSRMNDLGKTQTEIDTACRDMLLDPLVDREEVEIMGKAELCLEIFGSIQKYVDESSGVVTSLGTKEKATNADSSEDIG